MADYRDVFLEDFAPTGPVSDWAPILETAIASFPTIMSVSYLSYGGTIRLRGGTYPFSRPVVINRPVRIVGPGTPMSFSNGPAQFQWPASATGLIFQSDAEGDGKAGDGVILENLTLNGNGGTGGNGIEAHAKFTLRNVNVRGFGGNGIAILSRGAVAFNAQADLWVMDTVWSAGNGGHGLYLAGGDSNAGVATMLNVQSNKGWGVLDNSFLGNTFNALHSASNVGGHVKVSNINARCSFFGCYIEGGAGPAIDLAGKETVVVGGLMAASMLDGSFVGDATVVGSGRMKLPWQGLPQLILGGVGYASFSGPYLPPDAAWPQIAKPGTVLFTPNLVAVQNKYIGVMRGGDGKWYPWGAIGSTPIQ